MAQGKICLKLNELQEVLLNDKDFLKRAVESFCQKLKDVEMTQLLQADKYQRQDEKVWLSQRIQTEEAENKSRNPGALCPPEKKKADSKHSFLPGKR